MPSKAELAKLGMFDRLLYRVSPDRLADRLKARHQCDLRLKMMGYAGGGAYKGARDSNKRNRRAWQRSYPVDEDTAVTVHGRQALRLECMDLFRNFEVVGAILRRIGNYVVPRGSFMPQVYTRDPKFNKLAKEFWWESFVPHCDARHRAGVTYNTLLQLKCINLFVSGDSGHVAKDNGLIMPVEAERIATPNMFKDRDNIIEGVQLRGIEEETAGYYVCARGRGGSVDPDKYVYVPQDFFRMTMKPDRIDQIRGIPRLANALAKLVDIDETDEYVLNKIKLDATEQWAILSNSPDVSNLGDRDVTPTGQDQKIERFEWGTVRRMGQGDKVEPFASRTPNAEYVPYLEFQIKLVAAAIGIPWEYLMMIFTEGSWTSHRQAKIEFKRFVHEEQDLLVLTDVRPDWYWRITKAVMDGDLPEPPADDNGVSEIGKVHFTRTKFELVDPGSETDAQINGWKLGTTPIEDMAYEQGDDPDEMMDGKDRDIQRAHDRAMAFNKRNPGANLTWRDYIDVGVPGEPSKEPALARKSGEAISPEDDTP